MAILLINPAKDDEFVNTYNPMPTSTLETIASYYDFYSHFRKDIEILNEDIICSSLILQKLPYKSIVGISCQNFNIRNAIKYAKKAKKKGNLVVFGGPYPSAIYSQILDSFSDIVDCVVIGDGEKAFLEIADGVSFDCIDNIAYLKGRKIQKNNICNLNQDNMPLWDFKHTKDYQQYYNNEVWIIVSGIRGCINAVRYKKRCAFCSIPFTDVRLQNPQDYWEQIKLLQRKYKVNRFYEAGDIFCVGNYPELLAKQKPKELKILLGTNEAIASFNSRIYKKYAKYLGISQVFLGVEHINQEILKINKNITYNEQQIISILETLSDLKIGVSGGFIFGLPGESLETAKENKSFINRILQYDCINRINLAIATPHYGTDLYRLLEQNNSAQKEYVEKTGQHLSQTIVPDYNILRYLNVKYNCNIPYDELLNIRDSTKKEIEDIGLAVVDHMTLKN